MKKILATVLLLAATSASAHGYYYGGYRNNWVAPFVVGAGIGYLATRPTYVYSGPYYPGYPYYPPQVVYVQQPSQPAYVMPPPAGYHYADIIDPSCNCQKVGLVPN